MIQVFSVYLEWTGQILMVTIPVLLPIGVMMAFKKDMVGVAPLVLSVNEVLCSLNLALQEITLSALVLSSAILVQLVSFAKILRNV